MYFPIIKYIRDVYGDGQVDLHHPLIDASDITKVSQVIKSGYVSSMGPEISKFEDKIRLFTGSPFAISTNTGTAALHSCLMLIEASEEDIILVSPLTFVATVNAISYTKATPYFLDVEPSTLSLSLDDLNRFINEECIVGCKVTHKTTNKIVKAVIITHPFGFCGDIKSIAKFCKEKGIVLIEDAAGGLGSFFERKHLGTFGDFGILSFNGNKIITTGGGGMILTSSNEMASKAKHMTTTAKMKHDYRYIHDSVGYNYRMPNLNAAFGLSQISKLHGILEKKLKVAEGYRRIFEHFENLSFFSGHKKSEANFWLNVVIFKNDTDCKDFIELMLEHNILVRQCWDPIHTLKPYKEYSKLSLHNSEWLARRLVNLPSSA